MAGEDEAAANAAFTTIVAILQIALAIAGAHTQLQQEWLRQRHERRIQQYNDYCAPFTEQPQRKRPRIWMRDRSVVWYDNILLNADDDMWISHMRMEKNVVQSIAELLRDALEPEEDCIRCPIPLLKRTCIVIYKLASCAEYRVIAELFGVSITSVHRYVIAFCRALAQHKSKYIKWPTSAEGAEIADRIKEKYCYPQAFGAVDGSHIPITPPLDGARDFSNRKGWSSVVLQGVVDDEYLFRDVYCRVPGSAHDANVFMRSSLPEKLASALPERSVLQSGTEVGLHLLGDPAYALSTVMMKPYPGRFLTPEQESFNAYQSTARMMVENSFGRLKARWRMVAKCTDCHWEFVPTVITACCILHNICEKTKTFRPEWLINQAAGRHVYAQPENDICRLRREGGAAIRDAICQYLAASAALRRQHHLH